MSAQVTVASLTAELSRPPTRYVKGETRYMKIQNPGRAVGPRRTPQKSRDSEKSKLAMLPPFSAVSTPAMIMCEKVDENMIKVTIKSHICAPRSVVVPVREALA